MAAKDKILVPDFEPEIENKISETLSTVAMDVDLAGDFDAEAALMEAEEELFGDEKEIDISLQKKKILTVVGFSVIGFIIVFVLFWFVGIYTGNNFSRQVSKGNDFYNKGQYEEALTYYEKALIEEKVEKAMNSNNIKVEYRENDKWILE